MADLTAGRNLQTVDVIYESDEIMGPGWLMFFTETIRVIPPHGGGPSSGGKGKGKSSKWREEQLRELALDEDDLIDIMSITVLSGVLD